MTSWWGGWASPQLLNFSRKIYLSVPQQVPWGLIRPSTPKSLPTPVIDVFLFTHFCTLDKVHVNLNTSTFIIQRVPQKLMTYSILSLFPYILGIFRPHFFSSTLTADSHIKILFVSLDFAKFVLISITCVQSFIRKIFSTKTWTEGTIEMYVLKWQVIKQLFGYSIVITKMMWNVLMYEMYKVLSNFVHTCLHVLLHTLIKVLNSPLFPLSSEEGRSKSSAVFFKALQYRMLVSWLRVFIGRPFRITNVAAIGRTDESWVRY